jgi:hypothetical protein
MNETWKDFELRYQWPETKNQIEKVSMIYETPQDLKNILIGDNIIDLAHILLNNNISENICCALALIADLKNIPYPYI